LRIPAPRDRAAKHTSWLDINNLALVGALHHRDGQAPRSGVVLTSFKMGGYAPVVWYVPADLPGQSDPWFKGDPRGCRGSCSHVRAHHFVRLPRGRRAADPGRLYCGGTQAGP
jgi:hypothetical protein